MDKEKVIQELQERTEEIKEKAGELHKAIEETISHALHGTGRTGRAAGCAG